MNGGASYPNPREAQTNSLLAAARRTRGVQCALQGRQGTQHLAPHVFSTRSVVRLAMNKTTAALEDAVEAATLAPVYPEAYVCKGDALMAMEQYEAAGESYSIALDLDPSIRRSKSFKAWIAKLQEKLATTNC